MPPTRTTVFDARWARHAGATTFSTLLLRGLGEVGPAGRWLVWGPEAMAGRLWAGAEHVPTSVDPAAWFGQRSALRVPDADLVVHPHQTRPVHTRPAATCVLDLIQLQDPRPLVRAAKSARLRASVRAASAVFTITSSVRDELAFDFGVDPEAMTVLELPVDLDAAARVEARRAGGTRSRHLLAVGRFDAHKNLPRLLEAFAATRFAAEGGQLHLAGGTVAELARLGASPPPNVRVLGVLDPMQMETAMAGATALVQASLVEGYGLPVAEALAAGVPVVSSPVPAVIEFGPPGIPLFDPRSVPAIRDAIDLTVDLVDADRYWPMVDRRSWLAHLPTPRTLANQLLEGLEPAYR